jgi:hypothetical protein
MSHNRERQTALARTSQTAKLYKTWRSETAQQFIHSADARGHEVYAHWGALYGTYFCA